MNPLKDAVLALLFGAVLCLLAFFVALHPLKAHGQSAQVRIFDLNNDDQLRELFQEQTGIPLDTQFNTTKKAKDFCKKADLQDGKKSHPFGVAPEYGIQGLCINDIKDIEFATNVCRGIGMIVQKFDEKAQMVFCVAPSFKPNA